MERSPQIHYLRASAGAGKTYQLTIRFLSLLARIPPSPRALGEVCAITFTNQAAAEMKERVIRSLKEIALQVADGTRLTRQTGLAAPQAAAWLDVVLANYGELHCRTIDSLVYALLRALSLEMGLPPELKVVFDREVVLERCLDQLFATVAWDDPEDPRRRLLSEILDTYLEIEEADGLVVEGRIRKRLFGLYNADEEVRVGEIPDLDGAADGLRSAAESLARGIRECGVEEWLNKRSYEPVYLQKPDRHIDRPFFAKRAFAELVKKRGDGIDEEILARLDALYQRLLEARMRYLEAKARARIFPYLRGLEMLSAQVRRLCAREGLILVGGWHAIVRGYLKEHPAGGAYALMKLGGGLHHFLIDEFQDTSRPQLEALTPLIEEGLATGGSLFFVGDVKQAIYGWRGGDPRLFSEVAQTGFPAVPPEGRRGEILKVNYRSLPQIVKFNNRLYKVLATEEGAIKIAGRILGEEAPEWACRLLAKGLAENFADVEQELPRGSGSSGKVEVIHFLEEGEGLRLSVRERLAAGIKGAWGARGGKGIAVLVRRNRDAEECARWLMGEGIPVVTENSLQLGSSDLIKGLISFLRFLDYPLDDLSFWGALASRLFAGVDGLDREALASFLSEGGWEPPLYKVFSERFPVAAEAYIKPLLARVGFVTPYDLARGVVESLGVLDRFPEEGVFIYRLFELIHRTEGEGERSLAHFLRFWDEGGVEEKIGLPEEVMAVRVLTVHKAKGLEFPVVFVPFTNWRLERPRVARLGDGSLCSLKKPLSPELERVSYEMIIREAIEEINLLYVATTRAREELYLFVTCTPKGRGIDTMYLAAWLKEMLEGMDV